MQFCYSFMEQSVCKIRFSPSDHLQLGEEEVRVEDHKRQLNEPDNAEYSREVLAVELQTKVREYFTITEKAPTRRGSSWLKAPTSARHYAKRTLTHCK